MTMWESENEYAVAAQKPLPAPSNTPYRTPSRHSRRSSGRNSISPAPSRSPPAMPSNRRGSKDVTTDESISILDPRRFTPTLHANLVSEILALRRDQEEKGKVIEGLENDLHNTRGEHEQLEGTLQVTAKENRSLKRQLALLEGGTSSALSELARERDEAVEANSEIKRRLDSAQKKIRIQEDGAERVLDLWQRDKENWEENKRKYERRIHVAEGRLKAVLDEVAVYHAAQQNGQHQDNEVEEASRDQANGHGSDAASVRTMSLTNSIRFSTLNGVNGVGGVKANGLSLADELDDYESQTDHDGRESVLSLHHKRTQSRESVISKKHRRNMSMESLMRPISVARGRMIPNQAIIDKLDGGILEDDESSPAAKFQYVDTGVQYSPPASPTFVPVELSSTIPPVLINGDTSACDHPEVEANQRRKRVHTNSQISIDAKLATSMISAASQTLDGSLSSPKSPQSPTRAPPPPPVNDCVALASISTQTDPITLQSPRRAAPPAPIPIPSIQLHPPTSAPVTPKESLLPQHTKDAACQVLIREPVPTRSRSMQTEEIRVDMRLNLLPPHLQPSSISSAPPSPTPSLDGIKRFSPIPGNLPPRNPRRITSPRTSLEQDIPSSPPLHESTRDAYPGNNDDGPLAKDKGPVKRPPRVSSLFAGFENGSSDEGEDSADGDMSDNDYRTALSAPSQHGASRKSRKSPAPNSVPDIMEKTDSAQSTTGTKSAMASTNPQNSATEYTLPKVQNLPSKTSMKTARQLDKPLTLVTNAKSGAMRRTALIQSGVVAHQGQSANDGLPELAKELPPFPIPTRASSRMPQVTSSAPSDGRRSPTLGRTGGRNHYRAGSIRKVRSAAALPRGGGRSYHRNGSRSPPPMSPSTEAPESPQLPPMPNNDLTSPRFMKDMGSSRYKSHRQQPSTTTANTVNTNATTVTNSNSVGSSTQATSVVDAIAQTMVGEWMFKYVRRRKSFGVSEPNLEGENGNSVRHKRWVWLAPYERAVMWSSRQPTSGSALLGKSGRKLTIQSVLDVKDDNLAPKGVRQLFSRSILILTPARALKFTAINAERHYVWLTALSFLAHSSQAVPEIVPAPLPLPKSTISDFEASRQLSNRPRRNGIRDSIRVAKGKTVAARSGPTGVDSRQETNGVRESEAFHNPRVAPEPADAPVVPRFTDRGNSEKSFGTVAHNRKRSNTGPRVPPPLSFRGFSGPVPTTSHHAYTSSIAGMSVGTAGSSDIYHSQGSGSVAGYTGMSASGRSSIRTSDASNRPGAVVNNFFDAVGTMRMEAFISPMANSGFGDYPDEQDEIDVIGMHRRRSKERRRQRSRSRNRNNYYTGRRQSDDWHRGNKTAGEEDYNYNQYGGTNDPFRGF